MSTRARLAGGWIAVALSTVLPAFWAAWGSIENRAYRIAYNGYVLALRKEYGADYTACRCVRPA